MSTPYDPYQPPKAIGGPLWDEFGQPIRPGVITWFKVYAGFMGAIYGLVFVFCVLGFVALQFAPQAEFDSEDRMIMWVMMPVMLLLGLALCGAFLAAIFLPRKPWVWVYDLVLIALGLSSCLLWPMTIPLIIYWVKPETRAYFGRSG